jgi:hypothetical protein
MTSEKRWRSRAGGIGMLALLFALTIPAALLAETRKPAQWTLVSPHGSRHVSIKSARLSGLYPGASKELILTLRNSSSTKRVAVRRILVRNVATTRRSCAPSARNLHIRQYSGPPLSIPPRASRRVGVVLRMPETVANSCQNAVFKLRYSALTQFKR